MCVYYLSLYITLHSAVAKYNIYECMYMIYVHCTYVYMCVYYLSLYITLQGAVAKHIIVQLLVLYIDIDTNTKYSSIAD